MDKGLGLEVSGYPISRLADMPQDREGMVDFGGLGIGDSIHVHGLLG